MAAPWEVPEATVLRAGGPATPLGRIRLAVISPREPAMTSWPYRRFEGYSVALVLAGRGEYRDEDGIECELEAGHAIVVRPGRGHWYGPVGGGTWGEAYVVFDGPLFDLLYGSVPGLARPVLGPVDPAAWLRRLVELAGAPPPADEAAAVAELLALGGLLADLAGAGPAGGPEAAVAAARRLLGGDLGAQLAVPAVARAVGLGYETFRRRFTADAGVPPARYRDQRRIAAATELLRGTRLPQRDIAAMLGFADEFHFSKRYRQLAGRAPGAVRRAQP